MAIFTKTELELDHYFDPKSTKHYLNGELAVLHCHHYASLYTQLADDVEFVDGKALLADVSEDCFYKVLNNYYKSKDITTLADKISIAEQYYASTGLGQMNVLCMGDESAEVELKHSHLDEGWIKKWGKRDKPVNFITQGYIAAVMSLLTGNPVRTFKVAEVESIVTGVERSLFKAVISSK